MKHCAMSLGNNSPSVIIIWQGESDLCRSLSKNLTRQELPETNLGGVAKWLKVPLRRG